MKMAGRVINWVSRAKNWLFTRSEPIEQSTVQTDSNHIQIINTLRRFEPFVLKLQRILVWENPIISCLCVLGVNVLFWFAVNFDYKFYGAVFSVLLISFVYDVWIEKIWPEISIRASKTQTRETQHVDNSRILSMQEISHYMNELQNALREYYARIKTFRENQPGLFCCGMCTCFAILTVIGRTIPGLVIGYCLIMLVMVGPGIYIHLLHPPIMMRVWNLHAGFHSRGQDTDSEVEDYMPEQTGENMALLQLAGDANDEEQHDESLIINEEFGLDLHDMSARYEGSTDGLDISEFDLSAPPSVHSTNNHSINNHFNPERDSDGSDTDEDVQMMRFQSLHFNRDSSEEEELAFARGLAFTEDTSATRPATYRRNMKYLEDNSRSTTLVQGLNTSTSSGAAAVSNISLSEMLTSQAVQAVAKNFASLGSMGQSLISTVLSAGIQKSVQETEKQSITRDDSSSGESEEFELISSDDLS